MDAIKRWFDVKTRAGRRHLQHLYWLLISLLLALVTIVFILLHWTILAIIFAAASFIWVLIGKVEVSYSNKDENDASSS
jgi:hypothetical protein